VYQIRRSTEGCLIAGLGEILLFRIRIGIRVDGAGPSVDKKSVRIFTKYI